MTKLQIQNRRNAFAHFLLVLTKNTHGVFTTADILTLFKLWQKKDPSDYTKVDLAIAGVERYRTPGTWSDFSFHDRLERMLRQLEREGLIQFLPDWKQLHTWRMLVCL